MSSVNEFGQIVGELVDIWKPAAFPDRQGKLQGQSVILVPYNEELHAEQLFEAIQTDNSGESWTYLPYGPYDNVEDFKKSMLSFSSLPDVVSYTVLDKELQRPVGTASFLRILPDHGNIEIGHIHYSKLLKRSTAATEAIYLMIKYAFELGNRRVEWKCNNLNEPSKSAALRFGFSFEGVFRNHLVVKGRNRDSAWFAIIDSDWPGVRAKFEKWLSPANFDGEGKQIARLGDL